MIALVYLAKEGKQKAILSTEIAQKEKIPQRYLENILIELKRLGILGSKLGKSGGYQLKKKPEEIQLSEIIRHFGRSSIRLPGN